jgi:hypothetical protein
MALTAQLGIATADPSNLQPGGQPAGFVGNVAWVGPFAPAAIYDMPGTEYWTVVQRAQTINIGPTIASALGHGDPSWWVVS